MHLSVSNCPGRPAGRCCCCCCTVAAACVGGGGAVLHGHRRCSGWPGLGHISKPGGQLRAGACFSHIVSDIMWTASSPSFVLCMLCVWSAQQLLVCLVLAAAGMSGLDHINCVHCLLQVHGFGWQSLGSGVAVLLCRCAVGCHLWTACDWLCLTLSSCSWHRLVLLLALPYCLSAVGIAWFHACLVHRAWCCPSMLCRIMSA